MTHPQIFIQWIALNLLQPPNLPSPPPSAPFRFPCLNRFISHSQASLTNGHHFQALASQVLSRVAARITRNEPTALLG